MHLIHARELDEAIINTVFEFATEFKKNPWQTTKLNRKSVALLFFENSTRTRCSFELAAKQLGATVVNLDLATSATQKGETLLDTVWTLEAMQFNAFIVRHQDEDACDFIADNLKTSASIINAGNGTQSHPTQALLDAFTIQEHKKNFKDLSIAIVGDIKHSRVAHSNIHLLKTLGVNDLRLVGPNDFLPDADLGCQKFTSLDEGIKEADVVMMLRIQKERMNHVDIPNTEEYFKQFGLTQQKLALAKKDALVMHPGPMNRNVEIEEIVADGKQSVILQQVENGVYIRQAILALCLT